MKQIQKGKTCYSEEQVISMLEFLIDNIFVSVGATLFQPVVGIPMGTNCAPLLADLFLYSSESEFLQKLVKDIKVITKLPNSEQSYKGKVQTHNYINRQNQSTTGKL